LALHQEKYYCIYDLGVKHIDNGSSTSMLFGKEIVEKVEFIKMGQV